MFSNNYIVQRIQQDTYNDFISNLVPIIIEQYNPLVYKYEDKYDEEIDNDIRKYDLEIRIKNPRITYPKVCDNDGTTHELTSSLSRLRNYTYSSKLIVDIEKKTTIYEDDKIVEVDEKKFEEITIGKIPIMVNSKYCINSIKDKSQLDELKILSTHKEE